MHKTINNKFLLMSASLVWVLMMIFSYEFVSEKVNQNNQLQFEKTQEQAWDLSWSFAAKKEVIKSFSSDWQLVDEGIRSTIKNPELSLEMQGAVIDPSIQQTLLVEVKINQNKKTQGTFKLEFSDQLKEIFYVTKDLSLEELNQGIDLNALNFKIINPNDVNSNHEFIQWSNIQVLDAIVIRFYFPKPTALTIKNIQIIQTQAKIWASPPQVNCRAIYQPALACYVTNQIRHQQSLNLRSTSNQLVNQNRLSTIPALTWLVLAASLMILMLVFRTDTNQFVVLLFLGVFVAIGLLQQNWLGANFNYLRWPLLVIMLGVIWQNRQYVKLPKNTAAPVWFISIAFCLLMIGLNHDKLKYSFLMDLPQYFLWAWLQQLLIGPLVSSYLYKQLNTSKWITACTVGVLFSIIHAPNHILMLATLLGGVAWSYAWLKYENIYANAFSHAILALVFYQVMPEAWLGSARIGVFF